MPKLRTAFSRAVSKLKSPTSAEFSPAAWNDAFEKFGSTDSDRKLYQAAQWIGTEAHACRIATSRSIGPSLSSHTPEWDTIFAVAALNREYRTAVALKEKRSQELGRSGVQAIDAIAAERICGADGQMFSVADLAEHGIDTTENWLFDAARSTGTSAPVENLAPLAVMATRSYSFRKSLNTLWNGVWSDGDYCIEEADGTWRWKSGDPDRAALMVAWQARQEANLMNFPNVDRTVWPSLKPAARRRLSRCRGVTGMSSRNGKARFKVRSLGYLSRAMPAYQFERAALEGSYLSDFLDEQMLDEPALTVTNILLAWHTVLDIAELLVKQAPLPESLPPEEARALALEVDRDAVRDAIGQSLRVSNEVADTITDFLTFEFQTGGTGKKGGNKGLWAAPLVSIPGTDAVALPLPVLVTSNPARRAENWLEKGGVDDRRKRDKRGDRFEALFRGRACAAVASNAKFDSAACADREIKEEVFGEQIDLLVSFGGLCLVGEVKFFLMPADPHERDRYEEKLEGAAAQAKRKAEKLDLRRDVVAEYLGLDRAGAEGLRMLPVVVTAHGYGFSTRVDDVLVVEAEYLRLYLMGDDLITGRVLDAATGRHCDVNTSLYSDELSAARDFEQHMSCPFVLTRYLKRVVWDETPFPCVAHERAVIDVALLGDMLNDERRQAEWLRERLR